MKIDKKTKKVFEENMLHLPAMGMSQPINIEPLNRRVCVAVPTTGNVRVEWMMKRFGTVIPINWSHGDIFQWFDEYSPLGYVVADARNLCCKYSLDQGYEWTFFIDSDTLIPPDTFLKIGEYMREAKYPVVAGLYYCKSAVPEPLIFRGSGNGYFPNWKFGEKVEVDGVPMGCTLIHNSILKVMWDESEEYACQNIYGQNVVRRIFTTPRASWQDPESGKYNSIAGTEDLPWCNRVIKDKILEKAGWKEIAKKKYPFLCDTSLFCQHIDPNGIQYPGIKYKYMPQYKGSQLEKQEKSGLFSVGSTKGSHYEKRGK